MRNKESINPEETPEARLIFNKMLKLQNELSRHCSRQMRGGVVNRLMETTIEYFTQIGDPNPAKMAAAYLYGIKAIEIDKDDPTKMIPTEIKL